MARPITGGIFLSLIFEAKVLPLITKILNFEYFAAKYSTLPQIRMSLGLRIFVMNVYLSAAARETRSVVRVDAPHAF